VIDVFISASGFIGTGVGVVNAEAYLFVTKTGAHSGMISRQIRPLNFVRICFYQLQKDFEID
jgi:hypothetical protein